MSAPPALPRHDDLDNYDVDDFSDDPFASPPPAESKKRKEPGSGLGIDKEVSVQKRARIPNVKLDEDRLLGPKGIPRLRQRAADLRLKGRGHEFGDAMRLLSFYQLWLDDLFPKAKFLDALSMVEKAGHKKRLMVARNELLNEGKPKTSAAAAAEASDEDVDFTEPATATTSELLPITTSSAQAPQTPPPQNDVPDDDDLYDATPRPVRTQQIPIRSANHMPDEEDDLDALIAEAEGVDERVQRTGQQHQPPSRDTHQAADDFADDEAAMQEMDGLW